MCTNTTNIINNTTCHIDLNINQRELHLNNSTNSSLSNDYTIGDIMYFPHPEEMLEPWVNNSYFFPILFTYIVTFIVGVTGNLVVIWIMTGDRTNRSVTSIFLVSLAIADLLLLMISAPLDVAQYFVVQWDHEGTVCKLAAFAESVSAFASVLNLVAVTFERFVVIVFPIKSRSLCTMSNCKKIMILVWLVSLLMATPVIFTKELNDWKGFTVSLYRFVTLFAVPSVIMIVCYAWVIIELWISTKTMDELTQSNTTIIIMTNTNTNLSASRTSISHDQSPPQRRKLILRSHGQNDNRDVKKARQQVIKMLILVVILFLLCWGPRLIMEIIIKFDFISSYNHIIYTLRIIFYLLPFIHSCLNPIVYGLMSTKFRRRMILCLQKRCICMKCRRPISRESGQQLTNGMYASTSTTFCTRNDISRMNSGYTFTSFVLSCSQSADALQQINSPVCPTIGNSF